MKVSKEYYKSKRDNLIFTYIKTGNEPDSIRKKIESKGYRTFTRKDLLSVLQLYQGNNNIILDYFEALQSLDKNTCSYRSLKMSEWSVEAWQGFYIELNNYFADLNWGWVNNAGGGFWGGVV